MYVQYYMTPNPITIKPSIPIPEAREILKRHDFRHLPVVDSQGRLVGIVTDRDIRSAYPSSVLSGPELEEELSRLARTPVQEIMSTYLLSLDMESTLDDALLLLEHQKIGALPVLDEGRVVRGILSIRDLLKAYGELFGLREKGSVLIAFKDDGSPGILMRIVRLFENLDIPFTRLLRTKDKRGDAKGIIYVRARTYNLNQLNGAASKAGLELLGSSIKTT